LRRCLQISVTKFGALYRRKSNRHAYHWEHQVGVAPPVVFELHPPWDCGFRQFSSVLHQSESLQEFGSQPLKQHLPVAELDACCSSPGLSLDVQLQQSLMSVYLA